MSDGLVSAIIPVYNRALLLREAVQSVLDQTYRPIEIIIVDDGSTDETLQVADELSNRYPSEIKVLHIPNGGPGRAREAGRRVAQGEFIQYLDSDDLLLPTKFSVQVVALRRYPECGIAYGVTELIDEEGKVLVSPYKWSGRQFNELFPALLVDRWWNTHTPLYRRTICDAIGSWADMRMAEDWDYDARAGALGAKLTYCPEVVSWHRCHRNPRLTGGGLDLAKVQAFSQLIPLLYNCARQAGINSSTDEMRHFSRWAFSVARQAGAYGLVAKAKECFIIAQQAADNMRRHLDFQLYHLVVDLIGWRNAGRLSGLLDEIFRRGAGPDSLRQSWMKVDD